MWPGCVGITKRLIPGCKKPCHLFGGWGGGETQQPLSLKNLKTPGFLQALSSQHEEVIYESRSQLTKCPGGRVFGQHWKGEIGWQRRSRSNPVGALGRSGIQVLIGALAYSIVVFIGFNVNFTQAKINCLAWGNVNQQLPPSDWLPGKPVEHFLYKWFMQEGLSPRPRQATALLGRWSWVV